ncbi:CoA ester lyase [uncultured Oxalicibacterium sp.]|uniref:HpcH/HpaI aldolase/citrate lyase family protein n=1 Tax=uncultured Oxalicibacterium sp. TaxID=1168540 RepID=UPI0025EB4E92|nr:CoA ester lyase [uncultured Oxalicibacterium sp.]
MYPSEVLFQGTRLPVSIPVCDHYAGSEKLMRKSLALQHELGPVFDITFDCEDGAAHGNEENHAHLIGKLLADPEQNRFGRIGVRVHDLGSTFFEKDVAIILEHAAQQLAYIVVPKVNSAEDARNAIELINRLANPYGRRNLPVHVLIESHGSLTDVHAIAALPQVECLSFGVMDFVSEHYGAIPGEAMRSPGQFTHPLVKRAKIEIAAACHAYGKTPSHNVTTEIRDLSVVKNDAHLAATQFGYTRMWSIHPEQIRPIVQAFSPKLDEVNDAAAILSQAQAAQWGPTRYKDTLHDRASYRYYWTILQRAKLSGMALPDAAQALI